MTTLSISPVGGNLVKLTTDPGIVTKQAGDCHKIIIYSYFFCLYVC